MSTALPKGFLASGVHCGVRRSRPDLGLIISEQPSVGAGVFTQNTCVAAPVTYSKRLVPASNIKAIVTNSGQANAATGPQGVIYNQAMVDAVAKQLNCASSQVLSASTGVIGEAISINKICDAMPDLVAQANDTVDDFAAAILTTDLVPKIATQTVKLSGGEVVITGVSKGSGMIHPNMATMLGYLLTDAKLSVTEAEDLLKDATDHSFNMISVDGEMSTNDTVFMLANGASGVALNTNEDKKIFQAALHDISICLAKKIVQDGEGATKLIEVNIQGAPNETLAKIVARDLTISPLIKTAIHGASPNWGRIIARLGFVKVPEEILNQCTIIFQDLVVYAEGKQQALKADALKARMQDDVINITIDLAAGSASTTAWGCDLSANYIKINAEYVS